MSIQPINNDYYQNQNSEKSDLQAFRTDAKVLQIPLRSANQDQVTISESALSATLSSAGNSPGTSSSNSTLSTALTNVMNDLSTMNIQVLGRVHQIQRAKVKKLLYY